ncbi:uncharacterized protein LOC117646830 [Thrips palmi]|uniref:Uncharacterized protein LOC117646830 n=1 Tax=Thrips palmi TaxID=161013 RepID=A0A6P8YV59_THRPL|nr:uncharacterized protein LOC117646830 [Thrips palmi]
MATGHSHQSVQYHNYKTIVGSVSAVLNRYKAVLEFQDSGAKQRALLKVEKLHCKPELNPDGAEYPINYFVNVGTCVKCLCHKFDETGEHRCGWYVADVLSVGLSLTDPKLLMGLCPLMINRVGMVSQLDKRQGIISLVDEYDHQHDILFLASKFYISGKRINVKQALNSVLVLNDKLYFDAVPVDLEENDNRFSWFATVAWKHKKPDIDYDNSVTGDDPHLSTIKTINQNPKSQFLRGKGQILRILNHEYGVALGVVNSKGNHWQSILFHRSNASLFKFKLKNADLQQVFKKGDKIRFIAAAAPAGFNTQWVASYVGIDVCGSAKSLANGAVIDIEASDGNFKNKCTTPGHKNQ